MKRYGLITLLFILSLVAVLPLTASAVSTNSITYAVEASASTVSSNGTFTVDVKMTKNTGFCWNQAVVSFDHDVLSFEEYSIETSAFAGVEIVVNNNTDGEVWISIGSMMNMLQQTEVYNKTGLVAKLTFKAKADAVTGNTVIEVDSNPAKLVWPKNSGEGTTVSASTTVGVVSLDHVHTPAEPVKEKVVAPTCKVAGSYDEVVYCSTCKEEISRVSKTVEIDPEAHTPAEPIRENEVAASCTTEGSYESVVKCSACEKELSREKLVIEKNDSHSPASSAVIENVVAATCTSRGTYDEVVYCIACNAQVSKTTHSTDLLPHTPGDSTEENVVSATCTTPGSYHEIIRCKDCKTIIQIFPKEIAVIPHTPGEAVKENIDAPTCSTAGSFDEVVYCEICKGEISRETKAVEKAAHTPGTPVMENTIVATCASEGHYDEVTYCTACGDEVSRTRKTVAKLAHTPGKPATETEPQFCTVCGGIVAPALGHTHKWSTDWTSDANTHWHSCSGCTIKGSEAAHIYDNNCDTTCNTCAYTRVVNNHVYDNACDASCNVCGAQRTVAGHTYDNACDANCNVCGANRAVSAHTYGVWNIVTEPTATVAGLRERACTICGAKESEILPATGEVTTVPPVVDTTVPPTDNTTAPSANNTTTPPATNNTPDETDEGGEDDSSCALSFGGGIAVVAILGFAVLLRKKD